MSFIISVVLLYLVANAFNVPTTSDYMIPSAPSSIQTLGLSVWENMDATTPKTEIDWGTIEPSGNSNVSCYIRNESNIPSNFSLSTDNWNPTNASDYMSLSWDMQGVTLDVDEIAKANLMLSVFPNITGITTFSFDIIISAMG